VNHFKKDLEKIEKIPQEYIFPFYYLYILLVERNFLHDVEREIHDKINYDITLLLSNEAESMIPCEKLYLLSMYMKHHYVEEFKAYNHINLLSSIDSIRVLFIIIRRFY
jgi:hypothetical protein